MFLPLGRGEHFINMETRRHNCLTVEKDVNRVCKRHSNLMEETRVGQVQVCLYF